MANSTQKTQSKLNWRCLEPITFIETDSIPCVWFPIPSPFREFFFSRYAGYDLWMYKQHDTFHNAHSFSFCSPIVSQFNVQCSFDRNLLTSIFFLHFCGRCCRLLFIYFRISLPQLADGEDRISWFHVIRPFVT